MELQITIADEGTGQHSRLRQYLKSIADAEDKAAVVGKLLHGLHDGAEPRDRATAQVVAIAETTGHNHTVGFAKRGILVPDESCRVTEMAQRVDGILVAVAGGKL